MAHKSRKKILIVTCLSILLIVPTFILVALYFGNASGIRDYPAWGTFIDMGEYAIDPETILASIDEGNRDVFAPVIATPGTNVHQTLGSSPWRQSDYLKIADVLFEFVWKETPDTWSFYGMQFLRACQGSYPGFDRGFIIYFKTINNNGKEEYTAREIDIFPTLSSVSWGGGGAYPIPILFGWQGVDPKKLAVTADDVLKLAEENGGSESRLKVNNACETDTTLGADGWTIYYENGASTIFSMDVDQYTGKYKIPKDFK